MGLLEFRVCLHYGDIVRYVIFMNERGVRITIWIPARSRRGRPARDDRGESRPLRVGAVRPRRVAGDRSLNARVRPPVESRCGPSDTPAQTGRQTPVKDNRNTSDVTIVLTEMGWQIRETSRSASRLSVPVFCGIALFGNMTGFDELSSWGSTSRVVTVARFS